MWPLEVKDMMTVVARTYMKIVAMRLNANITTVYAIAINVENALRSARSVIMTILMIVNTTMNVA